MSTGDLHNNLEKLSAALRGTCVPEDQIDLDILSKGDPIAFLPLLHCILLDNSLHVARFLSENGYQLYPIHDRHFLEGVFRVVRNEFSYRPSLTIDQFLSNGFAERKIIFMYDVILLCKRKAEELERLDRDLKRGENNGILHNKKSPHMGSNGVKSMFKGKSATTASPGSRNALVQDSPGGVSARGTGASKYQHVMSPPPQIKSKASVNSAHTKKLDRDKYYDSSDNNSDASSGNNNFLGNDKAAPVLVMGSMHGKPSSGHRINDMRQTGSAGGWRSKKNFSLQIAHMGLEESGKSPTSSGPVSPVSITSAASAPAVYRQAPIKAKAEMIGHVGTQLNNTLDTEFHGNTHFSNSNRALECWVTSPPQIMDRSKKKTDSKVHHLSKTHASPRRRGGRPGIGQTHRPLLNKRVNGNLDNSSSSNSINELVGRRRDQGVAARPRATPTLSISRKLSLTSDTSSNNTSLGVENATAHTQSKTLPTSRDAQDMTALTQQISTLVASLDMLSDIPTRMEQMEKKMMLALHSMDKRITHLDEQMKRVSLSEISDTPKRFQNEKVGEPSKGTLSGAGNANQPNPSAKNGVLLTSDDGIDNFLKVIEARFRETETVLAESQN